MTRFRCDCGNVLFFDNFECVRCRKLVGYDSELRTMVTLRPDGPLQRCQNTVTHGVCNWLVTAGSGNKFCLSCRLNKTIPNLKIPRNVMLWGRIEAAKRRLIASLLDLNIPVRSKAEDPAMGLAFDFLSIIADPKATMGHLKGVITLNIEEADDVYRQISREQMGEPSRTLLGHLRHEMGHYIWMRWISLGPLLEGFRACFGDESVDYSVSLKRYYSQGVSANWQQHFITAYSAAHPWEDWAETFAHYLQICDGLKAFASAGCQVPSVPVPPIDFIPTATGSASLPPRNSKFDTWLQEWLVVSAMLNDVSVSMGQPALYPFIISAKVTEKLRFVDYTMQSIGSGRL
jgi:hypothetical protein